VTNGLVSICSNLILMQLFTGWLGFPALPANLAAIALMSVVNFRLGDRWVFALGRQRRQNTAI
jgi:putative flippase GtrA